MQQTKLTHLSYQALDRSFHLTAPFRWAMWWRLAILGILSGGLASYGMHVPGLDNIINTMMGTESFSGGLQAPEPGALSVWEVMDYSSLQSIPAFFTENQQLVYLAAAGLIAFEVVYTFISTFARFAIINSCQSMSASIWAGLRRFPRAALHLSVVKLVLLFLLAGLIISFAYCGYHWLDALYLQTPYVDVAEFFAINEPQLLRVGSVAIAAISIGISFITLFMWLIQDIVMPIMAFEQRSFFSALKRSYGLYRLQKRRFMNFMIYRFFLALVLWFASSVVAIICFLGMLSICVIAYLLVLISFTWLPMLMIPVSYLYIPAIVLCCAFVLVFVMVCFSFPKYCLRNLSLLFLPTLQDGVRIGVDVPLQSQATLTPRANQLCF